MKKVILFGAVLVLFACNQTTTSKETKDGTPAVLNGSDNPYETIAGIFFDTLPCSDCRGILTELKLLPDSTFLLTERKLNDEGRPKSSSNQRGVFSFMEDLKKIKLSSSNDSGKVQYYTVQENALVASDLKAKEGVDVTLEKRDRVIGKIGAEYVLYKMAEPSGFPLMVYSHMKGADILINATFLDKATDSEKAVVAYYATQYNTGCDGDNCALENALKMNKVELAAFISKWMPSINLPNANEARESKSKFNLAVLFFNRNKDALQVNYSLMTSDNKMITTSDDFIMGTEDVRFLHKGEIKMPPATAPPVRPTGKKVPGPADRK